jgi:hypothetical protein
MLSTLTLTTAGGSALHAACCPYQRENEAHPGFKGSHEQLKSRWFVLYLDKHGLWPSALVLVGSAILFASTHVYV